jgi:hypothetical protein
MRPEPGVLKFVRPPGVIEEMRRRGGNVRVPRLLDRLAVVQCFDDRELPRPLRDAARDPEQVLAPVKATDIFDQTFS